MIRVVAGVIKKGNKVLLCSRPVDKPPAGWEFPGGKVEVNESNSCALCRELFEELSIKGVCGNELFCCTNLQIELHFIEFFPEENSIIKPCENQEYYWVDYSQEAPKELLPNDNLFWQFLQKSNNKL